MNHHQPTVLAPQAGPYGAPGPFPPAASWPPPAHGPLPAGLGGPVHPAGPVPPVPPAPRRRGGLVAGLLGGGAVALAGLGVGAFLLLGPKGLVTDEVEAEIVRITQEQVAVTATDVACPDSIPVAVGSTVTCTGTVEGQTVTYAVTQDDDRGNLTITHDRLLPLGEVEAAVAEQLTAAVGEDVVAVCGAEGQRVLVNAPGAPIACTAVSAADPSITAEIAVTVDEAGTVEYAFA